MRNLIDKPEIEYVDGHAYPKVSPKRIHSMVQLAAASIVQRRAAKRGVAGPEWRFRLAPGTQLVPDVAYVSYERLCPLSDEEADEPPFAPDIAIEVRSPSHRQKLSEEKIRKYLAHGSLLVLDIDPAQRAVYAHSKAGVTVHHRGEHFTTAAVDWLQFDIDELFANIDIPR